MSAGGKKPSGRIVVNVLPAGCDAGRWAVSRRDGESLGKGLLQGSSALWMLPRVKYTELKQDAVRMGREVASRLRASGHLTQLVVHKRDGRIQFENTYGADPKKTKG